MFAGTHVLVGYDGTPESERALRWSAREAVMRHLPLTVCHAWRRPYPLAHTDHDGVDAVERMGRQLLDHGVSLVEEGAPALEIRGRLLEGGPYSALLNEGREAEQIVIGSHRPDGMPASSVALRLPARAHRPVVAVRPPTGGPIVVGVDGSAGADAALGFAFEEAALRERPLHAVYGCWEPGAPPDGDLSLFDDEDELRRVCGAVLERAVAPWLVKYPRVEARTVLRTTSPRQAMLAAARQAAVIVVGDRGTGEVVELELGATTDALVRRAPCTVAVIPSTVS
ncbi:universal stress protein [Actinomadura sp. WMMB 499]|uniref:universal stress protein n=1 Tax=Actinomadura sp. WMMB 499 TaxID=1219491 RepID=UPI0012479A7C|nr:universal stress protein [Actinomadura sp. WMMB 499]QFG21275.1 universal stress protein [Actinomadura sp. WMMB 499]